MEIWKSISGYEGIYEVSNLGRIKSLERYSNYKRNGLPFKRIVYESIVKQSLKNNYKQVTITKNNIAKTFIVHRIIAFEFISNNLDKPCVNHINGIKSDNNVLNLEWVTYSENIIHAYKNNLIKKRTGDEVYLSKKIICTNTKKVFFSIKEAAESLQIHRTTLSKMLLGKLKNKTTMVYL